MLRIISLNFYYLKDRSVSHARGDVYAENESDDLAEKEQLKRKNEELERLQKDKQKNLKLEQERIEQLKKKQAIELEAQRKAEEQAKMKADAEARAEAEAKARAEAEAKAKAEADARAKTQAETRAKVEAEARAKVRTQWTSGTLSSPGMPKGWEKRLDRTTGTCKYIDHNTGNIYAQPPQSLFGSPGKRTFLELCVLSDIIAYFSLQLKCLHHKFCNIKIPYYFIT